VLGPGGLAAVFMMPVVGVMVQRGHSRYILVFGIAVAAMSLYLMSEFDLEADYRSVLVPRIIQGLGMSCFFVPLTTLTMAEIPQEQMGNATGIFSLLRNLGGSVGVATAATLLSVRAQFHQLRITEQLNFYDPNVAHAVSTYARYLAGRGIAFTFADKAAMGGLYGQVVRQSTMLAFNDAFRFMFWATLAIVPLVILFRGAKIRNENVS
jgi:DHA2 family multidrug resistance protein